MFVFAAFGVQLYSGKLGKCNDFSIANKSDCHGMLLHNHFEITELLRNTRVIT